MAKIQLPNGIEIILSAEEVIELMSKSGSYNFPPPATQENEPHHRNQIASPTTKVEKLSPFSDEDLKNMLSIDKLVKSIEEGGRPFSFSLAEEQIKRFGTYYDNRGANQQIYGKVYRAFERVRTQMQDKYGGKWIPRMETKNGIKSNRNTLVEDIEQKTSESSEVKPNEETTSNLLS